MTPAVGVRLLVALSAALVLAGTGVATASDANRVAAAPRTLTLTDVKGDANAINGQSLQPRKDGGGGGGGGLGDHSGPIQKADSDIVAITLASTGTTTNVNGKQVFTCTGFTATMTLAAPAGSNAHYRVAGVGVVNSYVFWLRYQTDASGTWTYIAYADGIHDTKGRFLRNPAKLDGKKIIFTVTEADLTAVGEKLSSFKMSALGADTRTSTATPLDYPSSLAVPAWDTMDEDATKSFTPCA